MCYDCDVIVIYVYIVLCFYMAIKLFNGIVNIEDKEED